MSARKLHESWVRAGRRRIAARQLRARGLTFAAIGQRLGVSHEQARRDCA